VLAETGLEGIGAASARGSVAKRLSSSDPIVSEAGNELIVDKSEVGGSAVALRKPARPNRAVELATVRLWAIRNPTGRLVVIVVVVVIVVIVIVVIVIVIVVIVIVVVIVVVIIIIAVGG
jgi:hypothetical protein